MKLKVIARAFPKDLIQSRKGSFGKSLDYVGGAGYINRLNEAFDFKWSFEVKEQSVDWDTCEVVVLGRLTAEGIIKEQYGNCLIKFRKDTEHVVSNALQVGDDIKAAATDAMKKCASLFGIGLHLHGNYEREWLAEMFNDKGATKANEPESEPESKKESTPESDHTDTAKDREPGEDDDEPLFMSGRVDDIKPVKKAANGNNVCTLKLDSAENKCMYDVGIWGNTDSAKAAAHIKKGQWITVSYHEQKQWEDGERGGIQLTNAKITEPDLSEVDVPF